MTIVGSNDHVEFWDSESWAPIAESGMDPESIWAAMEAMQKCGF